MTAQIRLPGRAEPLVIPEPGWAARYLPPTSRRVYAAAHVAARLTDGSADPVIDWESTMAFRNHLWAHGFAVAEAMDTAQRGMGLSWEQARELIARSAQEAARCRADQIRSDQTDGVTGTRSGVGTAGDAAGAGWDAAGTAGDAGRTGRDTAGAGAGTVGTGGDTGRTGRDTAGAGAGTVGTGGDTGRTGRDTAGAGAGTVGTGGDTGRTGRDTAGAGRGTAGAGGDTGRTGWDTAGAGGHAAGAGQGRAGLVADLVCGVGTDQLAGGEGYTIARITGAYAEQMAFVQATGAGVVLMASRALAASARGARDYLQVYGELLGQAERPVIVHWLGEAFDPALRGYWGSPDFDTAADTVLELIERAGGQVDGIKLSVLDAGREVALRRRLPAGVRMYTGDDFHYADLIRGDVARPGDAPPGDKGAKGDAWPGGLGHSDALLGAFAAITAPAAAALAALDRGDIAGYDAAIGPTVPLSRLIFEPPTYRYKVGVAFLAWLNGLQPQFAMLSGLQRQRSARHLIRVFELAAAARALTDPELAAGRMGDLVATMAGPERV